MLELLSLYSYSVLVVAVITTFAIFRANDNIVILLNTATVRC